MAFRNLTSSRKNISSVVLMTLMIGKVKLAIYNNAYRMRNPVDWSLYFEYLMINFYQKAVYRTITEEWTSLAVIVNREWFL